MTITASRALVDVVVVTTDQAANLEPAVRRLHDHLVSTGLLGHVGQDWRIVIVDQASTDATGAVAAELAHALSGVDVLRFDERVDHKTMRAGLASRGADVVALTTIDVERDLDQLLAPLVERAGANADRSAHSPARRVLTRRNALAALGGAGLTALLAACGSSAKKAAANDASTSAATSASTTNATPTPTPTSAAGASGANTTTAGAASTAAPSAAATALAVEMTQGPYYLNLDLVRSDVREDRQGAPLALDLTVVDPSGAPIKGAVVDIWHCDADGVYSGFVSASNASNGGGGPAGGGPAGGGQPGQGGPPPGGAGGAGAGAGGPGGNGGAATATDPSTFLRGTQLADAAGKLSFTTIYPGWYQGRNVHIHVLVHVGGKTTHIGQMFFDDTFTDAVYASTAPYSARPTGRLLNSGDGIFSGGGDKSILAVTKSGDGYKAAMTMAVNTA